MPVQGQAKWKTLMVGALSAGGLVWLRGAMLARLIGGRYAVTSFAVDVVGFCALLLGLALLSRLIRSGCQVLLKKSATAQFVAYLLLMLVLAFPPLLVAIQLHPQRITNASEPTPAALGLNYQNVTFQSDGLTLAGWLIPASQHEQPIVLVTHGLNANKSNFLYVAKPLHEAGLNIFTFDFRAHGESAGQTITFGLNEAHDVKAAYDWLAKTFPHQPVYALGFSMGGAAIAQAAGEYGIFDRIALDSTFAQFENVVFQTSLKPFGPLRPLLWQLGRGWAWLWTQRDFAENIPAQMLARRRPQQLLLIHGTADSTIPVSEARKLKEATSASAELWLIEGSEHVQSYRQPSYNQKLTSFFTAAQPPR